jgi:hypothetical protein
MLSLLAFYVYSGYVNESNNAENHGNVHVIKDRSDWNTKLSDANNNGKVVRPNKTLSVIAFVHPERNQNDHHNCWMSTMNYFIAFGDHRWV